MGIGYPLVVESDINLLLDQSKVDIYYRNILLLLHKEYLKYIDVHI
jgi:hypothetical protein